MHMFAVRSLTMMFASDNSGRGCRWGRCCQVRWRYVKLYAVHYSTLRALLFWRFCICCFSRNHKNMYLPHMEICCMLGTPPTEPLESPSPQCRMRKLIYQIARTALGSRCPSILLLLPKTLQILYLVRLRMLPQILRPIIQKRWRMLLLVVAGVKRQWCLVIGPVTSRSRVSSRSSYRESGSPQ